MSLHCDPEHCDPEQLPDGRWRCPYCGDTSARRVLKFCGGQNEGIGERPPSLTMRAWSLAGALALFAADGFQRVPRDEYERRLGICDGCDQRKNNSCQKCGCNLTAKAAGRVFQCPLGKWDAELR